MKPPFSQTCHSRGHINLSKLLYWRTRDSRVHSERNFSIWPLRFLKLKAVIPPAQISNRWLPSIGWKQMKSPRGLQPWIRRSPFLWYFRTSDLDQEPWAQRHRKVKKKREKTVHQLPHSHPSKPCQSILLGLRFESGWRLTENLERQLTWFSCALEFYHCQKSSRNSPARWRGVWNTSFVQRNKVR